LGGKNGPSSWGRVHKKGKFPGEERKASGVSGRRGKAWFLGAFARGGTLEKKTIRVKKSRHTPQSDSHGRRRQYHRERKMKKKSAAEPKKEKRSREPKGRHLTSFAQSGKGCAGKKEKRDRPFKKRVGRPPGRGGGARKRICSGKPAQEGKILPKDKQGPTSAKRGEEVTLFWGKEGNPTRAQK